MKGGMSAIGTKRTSQPDLLMSAFGGKADMAKQAAKSPNDPKRAWTHLGCEGLAQEGRHPDARGQRR